MVAFNFCELFDAPFVPSPFKRGVQEHVEDLFGEAARNNTSADRQHIRVVVEPRHARRIQVVTEGRSRAVHLIRRDLFALARATKHNPEAAGLCDGSSGDRGTNRWVVHRFRRVRAKVGDLVPEAPQMLNKMCFQLKSRVI